MIRPVWSLILEISHMWAKVKQCSNCISTNAWDLWNVTYAFEDSKQTVFSHTSATWLKHIKWKYNVILLLENAKMIVLVWSLILACPWLNTTSFCVISWYSLSTLNTLYVVFIATPNPVRMHPILYERTQSFIEKPNPVWRHQSFFSSYRNRQF